MLGDVVSRKVTGDHLDSQSPEFARTLDALRVIALRPELSLTEVPAPTRLAPRGVALTADVMSSHHPGPGHDADNVLATGRFVLLHDEDEPEPWEGPWRIVTFARADMEPELATDPALGQVGWSWLTDALADRGLTWSAAGGTVTRVVSESFGSLTDREPGVEMEIRASWTPIGEPAEIADHLVAWGDLLCTVAGIPPLPDGVVALPGPRR